jgi:hypothetical protein
MEYFARSRKAYNRYGGKRCYNMDETFWRIVQGSLSVWGVRGSENRKVKSLADEKAGITICVTSRADGKLLPGVAVRKGKTPRCLESTAEAELWIKPSCNVIHTLVGSQRIS